MNNHQRYLLLDFLRIFAMLFVLLFHLQVSGFEYGYLGVDFFFVISGFLITGIIVKNLDSDEQWYKKFVIGRVNRIIPPLIVTVFITTIFGLFFLGDASLHDLSKSGLKSFYAISNHYFYSSGGYFDLLNRERPLLHTWTLSVELQFYFLWMVLFFIIGSRSNRFIINTLLVLISLSIFSSLIAVFFYQMERAVFFLMPFRVYEFALGGLSFYIINVIKKTTGRQGRNYNNLAILLPILPLLLYFLIDAALALNISISLLIFILITRFADKNLRINSFFEKLVKSLSVNTYTIYLVHYPIIIFLSYTGFEKSELILYSIILIALFTFLVNYLVRLIRLL